MNERMQDCEQPSPALDSLSEPQYVHFPYQTTALPLVSPAWLDVVINI